MSEKPQVAHGEDDEWIDPQEWAAFQQRLKERESEKERAAEILRLMKLRDKLKAFNALKDYQPYQQQKEFHGKSAFFREILLMGGNQLGKTYCGAAEMAYHLTGLYPEWWEGKRFPYPIKAIAGSETFKMTLAGIQENLLGPSTDQSMWGSRAIPKSHLVETKMSGHTKDLCEKIIVKHASGLGNSVLRLSAYSVGRKAWQAETVDLVWFDEEPPEDVYNEGRERTSVGTGKHWGFPGFRGFVYITFTPLLGPTNVVNGFVPTPVNDQKTYVKLGIQHVTHLTEEEKKKKLEGYPEHERMARAYGDPILGSGAVFNIDWATVICEPFDIPSHWPILNAMDLGFDHFNVGIAMAINPNAGAGGAQGGTIYVTNICKVRKHTTREFASLVRDWPGQWAWPHDADNTEKIDGESVRQAYVRHGLDMLPERTTIDGKSNNVAASVAEMLDLFKAGRLKIFNTVMFDGKAGERLIDEFNKYHRKDGKIVKRDDDGISAVRYGVMMRRWARSPRAPEGSYSRAMNQWSKEYGRPDEFRAGNNDDYLAG